MRLLAGFLITTGTFALSSNALGFTLGFEEGRGNDGGFIDGVPGFTFVNNYGEPWRYADIRTGFYNASSDDMGVSYGPGEYHILGYVSAWAGREGARGRINFDDEIGTWFRTGYSSRSSLYLDAFDADGRRIDRAIGDPNVGLPMGYLRVDAPVGSFIAYVLITSSIGGAGGGGDYWTVDDMSGGLGSVPATADGGSTLAFFVGACCCVARLLGGPTMPDSAHKPQR